MALWTFSEDSARFLFGAKLGDPVADQILEALRNAGASGLTRSDLHHVFHKHKTEPEIQRAHHYSPEVGVHPLREESRRRVVR